MGYYDGIEQDDHIPRLPGQDDAESALRWMEEILNGKDSRRLESWPRVMSDDDRYALMDAYHRLHDAVCAMGEITNPRPDPPPSLGPIDWDTD